MSAAFVRILSVTRLVVFAIVCMLSLAVLTTIGRFEHLAKRGVVQTTSEDWDDVIIPHSVPFDFALSAVTMVTLFVMLIVGFIGKPPPRRGSSSRSVGSLCGFLDILWLLSSVWTSPDSLVGAGIKICSDSGNGEFELTSDGTTGCTELRVSKALGWATWVFVSVWWSVLFAFAIKSAKNGESVWKSALKNVGSGTSASSSTVRSAPKETV